MTALGLGIKKQRGVNAVRVAESIRAKINEIQPQLPKGVRVMVNFDSTKFIRESVDELNFTLILSAILTALVCWLFLRSWSSTINVVLAIPTSIVGAFTVLYFLGFTLNTFTLLGLSLAVGIVVDDAIMVLENIVRHREMGKSRLQAALDGSKEITFAAIAATVAIAAIFIPVAFMQGVIGKFFLQFGVTMTVTVFLSLVEALTLTPMRCSQFLDAGHRSKGFFKVMDTFFDRVQVYYQRALPWVLLHRWKTLGMALFFFIASLSVTKWIRKEFVPAQDQSTFLVRLQTPVDSSIEFTDSKFRLAEALVQKQIEVERVYAAVGGFGGGEVTTGIMFITMKPPGKRGVPAELKHERSQQEFMDYLRGELKKIPDLKVFVQDLSLRGFTSSRGFPVEFSVRGPEWEPLAKHAEDLKSKLEATGLVTDVDSDYREGKPEIRIFPDRERAALRGVSVKSISETIRALVGGVVVGKYAMGGHRYDIRVRLSPEERSQAEQIKNIYVRNNRGELVRLAEVVRLEERSSLQQISRFDRERSITISANVKPGASQEAALEKARELGGSLPEPYHVVMSGSAETFRESQKGLLFALLLGILVAYMVLASQFNSFIDPLSVLMALPFSISGAFLALWISQQSLNIYSFIGLILLTGIVKKNSILLVEFTNQIRQRGEASVHQALLVACPIRLRPILMTSIATVAAAVPAALALGPGAETRIPMAVAIIGGVVVSTALSLLVVPVVYSLLARWDRSGRFEKQTASAA